MPEKRYYMACIDLEGRRVLVVGGGRVALEKVEGEDRTRAELREGALLADVLKKYGIL